EALGVGGRTRRTDAVSRLRRGELRDRNDSHGGRRVDGRGRTVHAARDVKLEPEATSFELPASSRELRADYSEKDPDGDVSDCGNRGRRNRQGSHTSRDGGNRRGDPWQRREAVVHRVSLGMRILRGQAPYARRGCVRAARNV